jgi:hypothetical protein
MDTMQPTVEAAPPRPRYLFVLQTGLITTAIALFGVYWLNWHADTQPMGWYVNYVIPIGAIIVGLVAGSGYGIASWLSGLRIGRGLLVAVLALQTCAYIAAEYIEYRDVLTELESLNASGNGVVELPSFPEYYDFKARNFAWKPERTGGEPTALGGWGYFFVLLGAAGFIFSSLIAPGILMGVPYCDNCQRYMSTKLLGIVPASVPHKKVKKSETAALEAYQKEQEQATDAGEASLQRLRDAITASDSERFKSELAAAGDRKANDKLPRRLHVSLSWCKGCESGRLLPKAVEGQGKQMKITKLPTTDASPEFVRAMLG